METGTLAAEVREVRAAQTASRKDFILWYYGKVRNGRIVVKQEEQEEQEEEEEEEEEGEEEEEEFE